MDLACRYKVVKSIMQPSVAIFIKLFLKLVPQCVHSVSLVHLSDKSKFSDLNRLDSDVTAVRLSQVT